MKQLSLIEVQQEAYKILCVFHNYCVRNKLRYQLAYGTCLGAIRHKGFIPWDDDVDVMMPRPDFERLVILVQENPIPGLELLSQKNNKEYSSPLAKVHNPTTLAVQSYHQLDKPSFGVYIDVFVVDGIPSSTFKQLLLFELGYLARRFWGFSVDYYDFEESKLRRYAKTAVAAPFKLIGYRTWAGLYDKICCHYDYKKQKNAGVVLFGEGIKKELLEQSLFEQSTLTDFEGSQFYVPQMYEEYLTKMYGDYMQLPPEEQRVSKHGTKFYYLENNIERP